MGSPWSGQIDLQGEIACPAIVALAIRVVEVSVPVPSGMIGIELLGAPRQRESAVPLARISQQLAQKGDRVPAFHLNSSECKGGEDGPVRNSPHAHCGLYHRN